MAEPGLLQSPRLAHRAGAALADFLALGVAAGGILWGVIEFGKGGWFREIPITWAQALICGAMPFWLPLRIVWRLQNLTRRDHRESLAITPIPAGKYLARQLSGPLIRSLAPMFTTAPVTSYYIGLEKWDPGEMAVIACIFLLPAVIASAGLGDLVVRLCRTRAPGVVSLSVPLPWAAAAIGLPCLPFWLFGDPFSSDSGALMLLLGFLVLSISVAVWRWRKAAQVYYRFE